MFADTAAQTYNQQGRQSRNSTLCGPCVVTVLQTAAMKPCFSDVFGYSCKGVQTSRLTVRSCSPLHCHCLTDTHTHKHQKKQSSILGFWTKVLEIAVPKTHPWVQWCPFEAEGVYWMRNNRMNRRWMIRNLKDTRVVLVFHLVEQGVISLRSFRGVILKQSVKGAQHSTTFIVGSQAVTKQLLQENGTISCAARSHSMCFARRVMVLMVLPPTSGRLTPEVIHVHSKERECMKNRMNRRWMQPNLQDTSFALAISLRSTKTDPPCQASEMNPQATCQECPTKQYRVPCG